MSDVVFPAFQTTDLAHADVFNTKVRTPGEAVRASLNLHKDDEANPHSVTYEQLGDHGNERHDPDFAECPHGNECHDPYFATDDHDHDGDYAPTPHDNTHHTDDFVLKGGDTMLGALVAQNNTNYTTFQMRNIIFSTADPDDGLGDNGDIWFKYEA